MLCLRFVRMSVVIRAVAVLAGVVPLLADPGDGAWAQETPPFSPDATAAGISAGPVELTAAGWSGVRAAFQWDRYGVRRTSDAYVAVNHAQQLEVVFTREGPDFMPRRGQSAWRWGLRLAGYEYGDRRQRLTEATLVVSGNRVQYRRGDLVEWYVNNERGIEQGFTINRRAAGANPAAPLIVHLRTTGTLTPAVAEDGLGVAWRDGEGETALWYSGLRVWDATGLALEARIEAIDRNLRLRVDDKGARYPVTIDPTILLGKLIPDDVASGDAAGSSVAISGNTVIVGAPGVDPDATFGAGAAYIFERDGAGTWMQVAKLTASDRAPDDRFGSTVGISGDTVIVGSPGAFDLGHAGAAYIFARHHGGPNAWGEVVRLTASDADQVRSFGNSVSISGDTAIVGAPLNTGPPPPHTGSAGFGAAYIFQRDRGGAGAWGEVRKIQSGEAPPCVPEFPCSWVNLFGHSVSIDGDTAIVGGTSPQLYPFLAFGSGTAFVFDRHRGGPDAWGRTAALAVRDVFHDFPAGSQVGISGDTAIVGPAGGTGAPAFIFARNQGGPDAWGEVTATVGGCSPGGSPPVAISGTHAVVGNPALACNGKNAFVVARDQGGPNKWGVLFPVKAADDSAVGNFGRSVAIDGRLVVVGDTGGSGINISDPGGAAYVCDLDALSDPDALTDADTACREEQPIVNRLVSLSVLTTSCCFHPEIAAPTFTVTARLANTSTTPIRDPFFVVKQLTGGNVLFVAGSTMAPDVGDEHLLAPGESVTVTFAIELVSRQPFRFLVDVRGNPEL